MTPTAYTVKEVCERLRLTRSTFYRLLRLGQLPMCEELKPRLGASMRFRSDLVERYLLGDHGHSRHFGSHRRSA